MRTVHRCIVIVHSALPDMDDKARVGLGIQNAEMGGKITMWACYIGEITKSYQDKWEPHTVQPDQKEPDVYDVIADRWLL